MNLKGGRAAVYVRAPVTDSAPTPLCPPPALVYHTNTALHLPFPRLGLRVATEGRKGGEFLPGVAGVWPCPFRVP